MPARYAPLPNNPQGLEEDEMEAAFHDPDSEGEDDDDIDDERAHLTGGHSSYQPVATSSEAPDNIMGTTSSHPLSSHITESGAESNITASSPSRQGTYDFENVEYDFPPPGSPPRADRAFANNWGNSNGVITSPVDTGFSTETRDRIARRGWLARAAGAILPTHYAQRLGLRGAEGRIVGGGESNDGVFANVTAKPTLHREVIDGEEVYVQPEFASKDAPPSYNAAQADAVPPYWESTAVHAPSSPHAVPLAGEMIISGMATGTLFAFAWNLLVTISFQFVGFLLTYLLHTTHAGKYGSRAGLGVTLIQYGFQLRADAGQRDDFSSVQWVTDETGATFEKPDFSTPDEAANWYHLHPNVTYTNQPPPEAGGAFLGDITTQWVAFLLMTIGWFLLLTSVLGFYRVKHWERSIIATSQPPPAPERELDDLSPEDQARELALMSNIDRAFGLGLRIPTIDTNALRRGFGFSAASERASEDSPVIPRNTLSRPGHSGRRDSADLQAAEEGESLLPTPNYPGAVSIDRIIRAAHSERALRDRLQEAGFI